MGSTRDARRAGSHPAPRAAAPRAAAAMANMAGSAGETPYSKARVRPERLRATTVPISHPAANIPVASRNTSLTMLPRLAPNAMRTPISLVRRET